MNEREVASLLQEFGAELAAAKDVAAVNALKQKYLGKSSALKQATRKLGGVPAEDRPRIAKAINDAVASVEASVSEALANLEQAELAGKFRQEWMDPTMPGVGERRGSRHPVTQVEHRCLAVMRQLGFSLVDGPEIEHPFYNFDALNIPEHHPARDLQDTFWLEGGLLLRSHTTPVQARVLEKRPKLPVKVASAGKVFRNEAVDATHLAVFHQLEGFWVDEGIGFAHLKGVLSFIARALYGDRKIRFKPKFYPYTEPSIGMDLACTNCQGAGCEACHGAGWVTIMGAGMVHPKLLRQFGYDPVKVGGIAFGWGTTRMTAQWLGLSRVKELYEPDLRLLTALHRA